MGMLPLCLCISSQWTITSRKEAEQPNTHLETEKSNRRFGICYTPEAVVCLLTLGRLFAASKSALSHSHSHSFRHSSVFLVRQAMTPGRGAGPAVDVILFNSTVSLTRSHNLVLEYCVQMAGSCSFS
jgi:hypothetical protein